MNSIISPSQIICYFSFSILFVCWILFYYLFSYLFISCDNLFNYLFMSSVINTLIFICNLLVRTLFHSHRHFHCHRLCSSTTYEVLRAETAIAWTKKETLKSHSFFLTKDSKEISVPGDLFMVELTKKNISTFH